MIKPIIFFAFFLIITVEGFKNIYPKPLRLLSKPNEKVVGDPLILTPLIESGKIAEAQKLSKCQNLTDVLSYSGYFTVNKEYNANLFFWYFPAAFNAEKAPVLLWLQGGPGGSSLFGLFVENGPFIIDANNNIQFRTTSWSLTHNVIYIDNPVGTGYSFADDDKAYARTEDDVARDLYSGLSQFFQLFPDLQKKDFYVTGESYAGKYVPAISYKIHQMNQSPKNQQINLKGLAIGDGFSDPINMLNYGEYLYNIGLLDSQGKAHFDQEEQKARDLINKGQYLDVFNVIDSLLDGDIAGGSYFKNVTGLDFYFNFLISSQPPDMNYYSAFVQTDSVRSSLHVGKTPYNEGTKVEMFLREDMYKSVKPLVEFLLDAKYKVLIYSGQLDIIVANTLTDNFIRKLKWYGAQDFENAPRKIWRVGTDIGGYAKSVGKFSHVLVRNAGHMIPYDQPKFAFDMINRFTSGKPYA